MKKIFVYGLCGTRDNYRIDSVVRLDSIEVNDADKLKLLANYLVNLNPSIKHVYAYYGYNETIADCYKSARRHNLVEDRVVFKTMLEKYGTVIM